MFPPGLEPGTFRVLGERDNHYTTETLWMGDWFSYMNYIKNWSIMEQFLAKDLRRQSTPTTMAVV